MSKVPRICARCRKSFFAKQADVGRGGAKFCSFCYKASHQEKKTGQYASRLNWKESFDTEFSTAHLFSNEE